MRRGRTLFAFATLALLVVALGACAPEEKVDPAAQQAADDLAWLRENKPMLDAKRAELGELRMRLKDEAPAAEAAAGQAEGAEGEAAMAPEEMETKVASLETEIVALSDEVVRRAINYLNTTGIVVGGELTPEQKYAADIKIEEDILVGKEYIDKGGDYARALDIFQSARQLDTSNEKVAAAIAEAEALRYMTEDRFAQVKKNMSQDDVRGILGQVKLSNVKEFPEKAVVGWFYRKEDGGAAAVYFREKKKGNGEWQVYDFDYDAVERPVEGGETSEG